LAVEEELGIGDGVNVAVRLETLADPGGICVSRAARDQVRDRLDVAFEDLGEQQLKNIARPIRAYRIQIARAGQPKAPLPLPEKPSLAVLPFQNMTGDTGQDYFVDGIVEEITNAISRVSWLFVIARNSSFTYKGKLTEVGHLPVVKTPELCQAECQTSSIHTRFPNEPSVLLCSLSLGPATRLRR
jgi:adenylate cyclase